MSSAAAEWPPNLVWIIERLQRRELELSTVTPMDDGDRTRTRKVARQMATVDVSAADLDALRSLQGKVLRAHWPPTGREEAIALTDVGSGVRTPIVESTETKNGETTYRVVVALKLGPRELLG